MQKNVIVIGAGFAGLSAATTLASKGFNVTVIEKHQQPGGRVRQFTTEGFVFDMGPSWYWMPDVFERYFQRFGKTPDHYYELVRLDPSYRIFYENESVDIPASFENLKQLFEEKESGSSKHLQKFIKEAACKYNLAINKLVYKPGQSLSELFDPDIFKRLLKLHIFTSVADYIRKYFKHPQLIKMLEFPVLFLGAAADATPALYTLMNYADLKLGTWYPMGGMARVTEAMYNLAKNAGAKFKFDQEVIGFEFTGNRISAVKTKSKTYSTEIIISAADYQFIEQKLLPKRFRQYNSNYWQSRTMAPSSLIFYIGIEGKVQNLLHHNLFFDEDFTQHSKEIYDDEIWPSKPLFYVCCPSKTDHSVAPEGCENLFVLIPIASGLPDEESTREDYYQRIVERLEKRTGDRIGDRVIFKRSFSINDFVHEYNSFKGNAYGLANTLKQTANLKPSMRNKRVNNLYYTGQLTVPGPGLPPSLISGQVVADLVTKTYK